MNSSNKWSWSMRAVVKTVIILVLAVIVIGPVLTPVAADARDDRGRHGRPAPHGRYFWHGEYYDYPPPGYYAPAPPPVYAPPPPPPGINFVFPLHIR